MLEPDILYFHYVIRRYVTCSITVQVLGAVPWERLSRRLGQHRRLGAYQMRQSCQLYITSRDCEWVSVGRWSQGYCPRKHRKTLKFCDYVVGCTMKNTVSEQHGERSYSCRDLNESPRFKSQFKEQVVATASVVSEASFSPDGVVYTYRSCGVACFVVCRSCLCCVYGAVVV